MKIEYLGHACFRIDGSLVIDPYKDGSVPGLAPLRTFGSKVICSHEHADHSGVECVEIVSEAGSAIDDFEIKKVPSFHDDANGALRGPNTIFVITAKSGEKLVHLGDLGHFPNDEQLAMISDADYLLIPVGGYYTIDANMAVKICEASRPKCVIPMHYRTANSGYPELSTVDEFLKLCDEAGIFDKVKVL
ncbi:MAG: MBL fold metallo-hydrolase [Candidatus Saccharibacteria bacterium]|nr:MBL fold metallo-hydrolase [Candidatus Saccharibacteria bacterium]